MITFMVDQDFVNNKLSKLETQILYPPNASVDVMPSTQMVKPTSDAPSQCYCLINNVFIASLLDSNINTCAATTAAMLIALSTTAAAITATTTTTPNYFKYQE
ncbi:hypothetical protein ACTFIR_000021 [Dictyostelium discoideum]